MRNILHKQPTLTFNRSLTGSQIRNHDLCFCSSEPSSASSPNSALIQHKCPVLRRESGHAFDIRYLFFLSFSSPPFFDFSFRHRACQSHVTSFLFTNSLRSAARILHLRQQNTWQQRRLPKRQHAEKRPECEALAMKCQYARMCIMSRDRLKGGP